MEVYVWLFVLIACLIAEAITTQLVSLWFVGGAIGAMIAARCGLGMLLQFIIFVILSFVLLFLFRPMLRSCLRLKRDQTNADRILNQKAIVTQMIDNERQTGQIRLMGQIWTARNIHEDERIAEGETVVVRSISGVKAMVETLPNGGTN